MMMRTMLQNRAIDVFVVNISLDYPAAFKMSFFSVFILSKPKRTKTASSARTHVVKP